MLFNNLIDVDNVLVHKEILTTKFVCDLKNCKGACCTFESDFGAPLEENEINKIEEVLDVIFEYLSEENVNEIKKSGFYEFKKEGLFIKSIDQRECIFVYYEGDIAKCAIEKAFLDNKINFRKPISCHLFPIRITKFGGDILRYEKFSQCEPALEMGKKEDKSIAQFCKDSLIRLYGEKWYSKLMEKNSR